MKCDCGCGKKFKKKHPSQRFATRKCKDRYHNRTNPRGYYAHLNPKNMTDDEIYEASTHPFSEEAVQGEY